MRVRCALRRRVCTRFGFAVAARGGGRRIARLGPCQPVCALRASCGDHAAAGAAGRVPPCTSPAGPRVQVSRRSAVRNESRTRARVARGGPGACEPGHGAGGCASAPAPGVGGAGGGRCGEASFSYRFPRRWMTIYLRDTCRIHLITCMRTCQVLLPQLLAVVTSRNAWSSFGYKSQLTILPFD